MLCSRTPYFGSFAAFLRTVGVSHKVRSRSKAELSADALLLEDSTSNAFCLNVLKHPHRILQAGSNENCAVITRGAT